jgi:sulfur carrier protein ThiS
MEKCGHCGETFEDESTYLSHLAAQHENDLTSLERRKVEAEGTSVSKSLGDRLPSGGFLVLVVLIVFSAALVAFVSFGLNSGGSSSDDGTPSGVGSVHYHGSIDVVIEGDRIDFSQSQYQLQADAFHFEAGNGQRWHVHARGVTLQWAMQSLGIEVTRNAVTVDGETYRDGDPGTSVTVAVNGDSVEPADYVLREGDTIEIVAETDA